MFERYIIYDVEGLLKNMNDMPETLETLKDELKGLGELTGIDYSKEKIQTSQTGDSLENEVIRIVNLKKDIKTYTAEIKLSNKAWNRLSDKEKDILDIMYRQKRERRDSVEYACQKLNYEKTRLYEKRNEALAKFKRYLFGA